MFGCQFLDEETETARVEGAESRVEPRSGATAAFSPTPLNSHLLSSSFVVLPGTKKPQLFSDQNVFHNKPSGAFTHITGMSPCALLAVSLLISVKMEVFEVC